MKKPYFIVLPLLLIAVVLFVLAKHNKVKALKGCSMDDIENGKVDTLAYSKLTTQERNEYIIKIDQSKISASRDTILDEGNKFSIVNIPVRLSNHSDNTLQYIMWTCSFDDEFYVSKKDIEIFGNECQANFPNNVTLGAHADTVYKLMVRAKKYLKGEKFKVAMSMFILDEDGRNECALLGFSSFKGKNLIWSNEVFLPR